MAAPEQSREKHLRGRRAADENFRLERGRQACQVGLEELLIAGACWRKTGYEPSLHPPCTQREVGGSSLALLLRVSYFTGFALNPLPTTYHKNSQCCPRGGLIIRSCGWLAKVEGSAVFPLRHSTFVSSLPRAARAKARMNHTDRHIMHICCSD